MKLNIWKWIAGLLATAMTVGAPGYWVGLTKVSQEDVSSMIKLEAPLAINAELKEIKRTQKSIEINIAKQSVQITQILEAVKK